MEHDGPDRDVGCDSFRPRSYVASMLYLCSADAGSEVEISVDGTPLPARAPLHLTGNKWRRPGWELQDFPIPLRL